MKISIIGYGNMAKALAHNLITQPDIQLAVSSPSLKKEQLPSGLFTDFNNQAIIENADLVVLAVKPFKVNEVLAEIGGRLPEQAVLLSVAAGITLEHLARYCPKTQPIVRSMPNTPIAVGKGVTALVANSQLNETQRQRVERLFNTGGYAFWIENEALLNPITALSGSGPAYVYLFLEALTEGSEKLGINRAQAEFIAKQTILGAIDLLNSTQLSPEALRQNVTSAGGTTAAALDVLQKGQFKQLLENALQKASERAQELGESLNTL
ncbi:pyrroline-5-carboxylate reductase [Legionella quinlivanii]|uniref:Pyrroline-5-carboxylate reductase n=1 Tax=Legionella quinlivanii TaxID=45073 RepID=A0A0W0Y0K9_9GAMM|nr:pyrroline-5-carboxylate reductase [Legionella quinlivanii]KTD50132.1 pyrroline-5-carboxylate reductase [Legionella quinlivanii]SEF49960.1 pyrroline-5-carboxylate reductase [Legionella quinlivanii DSM 21216]STY11730.1 pyrroline-5-carboxylate reductase [Legionella quinlivanii]